MLVRLRSALCALAIVALFTPALSFPAKAQDFVDDGSAGRELWRYAPGQAASCAFTVTTTSDSGAGSLRQAILDANASTGAETICFDIAGSGPHTIRPATALPQITDPVTIDGLTQPGADCSTWPATLQIEIDGSAMSAAGLSVFTSDVTIRGLVINRAGDGGVRVSGFVNNGDNVEVDNTILECNYLGTDVSGTTGLGNDGAGVLVFVATNTRIGGPSPGQRNLLSGNGDDGIDVRPGSYDMIIQGNYVGTDASGTAALPNEESGIQLGGGSGHLVGGTDHDAETCNRACNLVSGNGNEGIRLSGTTNETVTGVTVQGNFVGTDITGTANLGNGLEGITLFRTANSDVGGAAPGAGNLISGNGGEGVDIILATGNIVAGNRIGSDASGTLPLGNATVGVLIRFEAQANTIGGATIDAGNVIAGNGSDGVQIFGAGTTGNTVQHNHIGTDAAGTGALGNLEDGIDISNDASSTEVYDNVVSANAEIGVRIALGAANNVVSRNFIGTNASGDNLGNSGHGILALDSGPQVIGGACCEGNTIAFNGGNGVTIQALASVSFDKGILGNRIYQNAGLGIDLQDDGITLNDPSDGDGESSANKLQNYPTFFTTDYDASANEIAVSYAVDSDPALTTAGASTYPLRIEFFRADADGEEGAAFLGTDAYTEADYDGCVSSGGTAPCPKAITFTPAASVTAADFILATATDATGNTSEFSESGQPLPVELTAFTATLDGGSVRLAWKTATETDNAGFHVERSIGEGWQALAFVAGAGTTSQPQSYRFVDAELPFEAEALVYRLKQVDLDGASEYGPEVEVTLRAPERFALEPVFPNPVRGAATLRYALPQAGPVRLAVYDVLGRQVAVLVDGEQPTGRHAVAFDAGRLPSGLYLARLTGNGRSQTQRLTVVQ